MSSKLEKRKLPQGWRWAQLGDVCEVCKGTTPRTEWYAESGLHIIKFRDIVNGGINWAPGHRSFVSLEYENKLRRLKTGMTLIGADAHNPEYIGKKVAFTDSVSKKPAFFSGELISIAPRANCHIVAQWPFLWFTSHEGYKAVQEKVVGVHLNSGPAKSIEIPLPPLSEQKRIVANLNKKMATVEKVRAATLERVEAIRALPAAFLRGIFSFDDGKLPQGWRWAQLGEVADIFSGSSAPQGSNFFSTSGFPFVRVSDLSECGAGGIIYKTRDRLSDIAISDCSLKKAPKGAVVLPKSGAAIATNRRALLGIDAYIVSHLLALVAIPDLSLKEWIYFALRQIDMMDYSDNTGYPSLKKSVVEEIEIPLPPLSEQKRIVADMNKKMAVVEKARDAAEAESEATHALPAAFLREAFGGAL